MSDKYDEMYDAIDRKDWDKARDLILSGVEEDRDYYDYDDWPLIFQLIEAGQEDLALLWLDNGYSPFMLGGKINAGIHHWASKYGMPKLLGKCFEKGLDINEVTQDDHSPLWYAADNGHMECARLLLANSADVDGLELEEREKLEEWIPRKDTPLCAAANADMAKLLLKSGASLELGPYGEEFAWGEVARIFHMGEEILSPLTCAAIRGRIDVVRLLAERGVALDSQALRYIALGANYGKATLKDAAELIRMGADVNGEPGLEPLAVAARAGNTVFCGLLLDSGAEMIPGALNFAVLSGKRDCVELFLEYGDPASAIRLAAKRGAGSILDRLLEYRPDLVSHALLGAIEGCRLKLAREMLDRGANPDFHDKDGKTPLILLYSSDRIKDSFRYFWLNPSRYTPDWGNRTLWRPSERDYESDDYFSFYFYRPDNWYELLNMIDDDVREFSAKLIRKGAEIQARDRMERSVLWHACCRSWLKSISCLPAWDWTSTRGIRKEQALLTLDACMAKE